MQRALGQGADLRRDVEQGRVSLIRQARRGGAGKLRPAWPRRRSPRRMAGPAGRSEKTRARPQGRPILPVGDVHCGALMASSVGASGSPRDHGLFGIGAAQAKAARRAPANRQLLRQRPAPQSAFERRHAEFYYRRAKTPPARFSRISLVTGNGALAGYHVFRIRSCHGHWGCVWRDACAEHGPALRSTAEPENADHVRRVHEVPWQYVNGIGFKVVTCGTWAIRSTERDRPAPATAALRDRRLRIAPMAQLLGRFGAAARRPQGAARGRTGSRWPRRAQGWGASSTSGALRSRNSIRTRRLRAIREHGCRAPQPSLSPNRSRTRSDGRSAGASYSVKHGQ